MGQQLSIGSFLGEWSVARSIEDRLSGAPATFEGRAWITSDGQGALYEERGVMQLAGGAEMNAERRYLWRSSAGGIDVLFDDGRYFHRVDLSVDLSAECPEAEHWCDPDTYGARYDFSDWPKWSCVWQVRGPRKDYTMTSVYSRAAEV